jgi:hypothetical protein
MVCFCIEFVYWWMSMKFSLIFVLLIGSDFVFKFLLNFKTHYSQLLAEVNYYVQLS